MKKSFVLKMLMILMCGMLMGCGKSEAVKNVEAMIDGIGEVTVDSEESIKKAEDAYNALTDKEKEKVENAEQLVSKREELDECIAKAKEEQRKKQEEEKKAKLEPFIGTWKPILAIALEPFNEWKWGTTLETGDLIITADSAKVHPVNENTITCEIEPKRKSDEAEIHTYNLIDDQGITKLVSQSGIFVREEDFEDALNRMFVHVTLDENNIGDYIGGPIKVGKFIDTTWGDVTDSDAYTLTSRAYEDEDLIMLEYKDVKFEMYFQGAEDATTFSSPYPITWGYGDPKLDHFGRAEGEIVYIRKDFVSDISQDDESVDTRKITFTDGYYGYFTAPETANVDFTLDDLEF